MIQEKTFQSKSCRLLSRKLLVLLFLMTYFVLLCLNNLGAHIGDHHDGDGHEHSLSCLFESQLESHLPGHKSHTSHAEDHSSFLHLAGSILVMAFGLRLYTIPLNTILLSFPHFDGTSFQRKILSTVQARGPPAAA